MTIYAPTISSYRQLPKWRCTKCRFEFECLGKSTAYIIGIYESRRRFAAAHKRKKPRCEGPFEYVEGVKKL